MKINKTLGFEWDLDPTIALWLDSKAFMCPILKSDLFLCAKSSISGFLQIACRLSTLRVSAFSSVDLIPVMLPIVTC